MIDKINELIGKPYDRETYHCWTLVMELQPKAPSIDTIASRMSAARLMNEEVYSGVIETDTPKDMDICLLGNREGVFHHAGIYFQGMIIHADMPAVRAEFLDIILNRYPYKRFFTCE